MKKINIAVVGATGMVGREMLKALDEHQIPINNLYVFSSEKSAGTTIEFKNKTLIVEALNESSFDRPIDYALFSAGGDVSLKYAPIAAKNNIIVIDNSSAWRTNIDVPLVVPEVNPQAIRRHHKIIANPNCSTIQSMLPLKAIHENYKIKRIVYSTYQAVSGSGLKGTKDLEEGLKGSNPRFYIKQIANNVLPIIDTMQDNGYTKEEEKMIFETRKILSDQSIAVTATCVRVPVINGHSVSINIECEKPFVLEEVIQHLSQMQGLKVFDNQNIPTPLDVTGQDLVYVGRIRRDYSLPNGLNLWVVGDNIRKGAATNAVQILKICMEEKL
jgi:aspartate-semialdehyde dehydrogenase